LCWRPVDNGNLEIFPATPGNSDIAKITGDAGGTVYLGRFDPFGVESTEEDMPMSISGQFSVKNESSCFFFYHLQSCRSHLEVGRGSVDDERIEDLFSGTKIMRGW